MKDISGHLIAAKKLLNKLEQLNANPDLSGEGKVFDVLIDLDMVVQSMFFNMDIVLERK